MQHQHGMSDAATVCIVLVYKSTLTNEVGSISYALLSVKVFGSSLLNHPPYTNFRY